MNKKKKLPITILKSLEPFVSLTGKKFNIVNPSENLLFIKDKDDTSDFYFKIEKYEKKVNGSFQFLMDRKPMNEYQNENHRVWIDIKRLETEFKTWISLLDQYDSIESFYDDSILKANTDRFYEQFKILDKNADKETFNLEQQLYLEEYLKKTRKKLEQLKQYKTGTEKSDIEDLEKETEKIESVLTKESKTQIIMRLSKFWGKAQKTGLEVIKEIFIEVAAEITKRLMIG